jgi:hypothetical protein
MTAFGPMRAMVSCATVSCATVSCATVGEVADADPGVVGDSSISDGP